VQFTFCCNYLAWSRSLGADFHAFAICIIYNFLSRFGDHFYDFLSAPGSRLQLFYLSFPRLFCFRLRLSDLLPVVCLFCFFFVSFLQLHAPRQHSRRMCLLCSSVRFRFREKLVARFTGFAIACKLLIRTVLVVHSSKTVIDLGYVKFIACQLIRCCHCLCMQIVVAMTCECPSLFSLSLTTSLTLSLSLFIFSTFLCNQKWA